MIYVRRSASIVLFLIILLLLSAFMLLTFKDGEIDIYAAVFGGGLCLLYIILYNVLKKAFKHIDRYVLIICMFLTGIGLIIQYRLNPGIAIKQFVWFFAAIFVMLAALLIIKKAGDFGRINILFMGVTIGLLLLSLIFAKTIGGAKNWIKIGAFTMQPSEFAKITYIWAQRYFLRSPPLSCFLPERERHCGPLSALRFCRRARI